ncbi:hypothetical protein M422DRAFT_256525 [Sphaerobolus stellatus SS14]|uniref:Unplaced genomic scaffold SPHSTscaffold_68, whole genome shotgun sequence n=1 Tax=Sphaerobolus stellatus (strain SS14) TaxID=990650 RepID=A0A0C9V0D0_SPHS4|nr:hypothetical protein M422DRAFT_256525 [Sphaerobolus stellatus SS14]
MVSQLLAGMKKLRGLQPTHRKRTLSHKDLMSIIYYLPITPNHDDCLFIVMLLTGFFGLLRLGELTFPDNIQKCSFKKLTMCHSLHIETSHFSFTLPFHKTDRFYAGNTVMIEALPDSPVDPLHHMLSYLACCDMSFPLLPTLWITQLGLPPIYSWFISCLQNLLGDDMAGHSYAPGVQPLLPLLGFLTILSHQWAGGIQTLGECIFTNIPFYYKH